MFSYEALFSLKLEYCFILLLAMFDVLGMSFGMTSGKLQLSFIHINLIYTMRKMYFKIFYAKNNVLQLQYLRHNVGTRDGKKRRKKLI